MTDEERIKSILSELEHNYISFGNRYNDDAQGMKLIEKALKQYLADRWIPVTERLPEDGERVLITWQDTDGEQKEFISSCLEFGFRIDSLVRWWELPLYHVQSGVVAWRPLPKPYVDVEEKESRE